MNDEMEYLKSTRHPATQAGCCHWAPIVPDSPDVPDVPDVPDAASLRPVMPNPAESAVPLGEKKPD